MDKENNTISEKLLTQECINLADKIEELKYLYKSNEVFEKKLKEVFKELFNKYWKKITKQIIDRLKTWWRPIIAKEKKYLDACSVREYGKKRWYHGYDHLINKESKN